MLAGPAAAVRWVGVVICLRIVSIVMLGNCLPMEQAMCFQDNLAEIFDECPLQQNRVMTADNAAADYY